ncbi:hypothetical protein GGR55DRAFT_635774 [Xylaria sp. FL0064]|nr:hypothetical protein GGR55DRAFT_635774 [Xylaria sp. FL0064]
MAPINRARTRAMSVELGETSDTMSLGSSNEAQVSRATHLPEKYKPEKVEDWMLEDPDDDNPSNRLILSIDFGTTYSAVSYIPLSSHQCDVSSVDIRSIENYPGDRNREEGNQMKKEVPTEMMYPLDPNFRATEGLSRSVAAGAIAVEPGHADANNNDEDDERSRTDAMEVDDTMEYDIPMFSSSSEGFKWGYRMHEAWSNPATHFRQTSKAMNRFKLLLDHSHETQELRKSLRSTLKQLHSMNIIESEVQVIADFLTCLLRHVKSQLRSLRLYDDFQIETVLCVPAIWTQKACRDMQVALLAAMKSAEFKGVDLSGCAIENLFLVSEPEAAAAFILDTDPDIHAGQTFVLLDAGGGTVDANTYTVSQTQPLRLREEAVTPGGGLCGSSYLNEGFRKMLHKRLETEKHYLESGVITLDGIVEHIMMNEFEYKTKRQFDIYDTQKMNERYYCANLQDNHSRGFYDSNIYVRHDQIKAIFTPCLEQIARIMEGQIEAARQIGVCVDKVVPVGGFAGSPSLRGYLERHLRTLSSRIGFEIEFIVRQNNVAAVASGAVLRALNKNNGPKRSIRSSYGIRRDEHYDPKFHKSAKPYRDPVDGLMYVRTIDWVLQQNTELHPVWRCEPFLCEHAFREDEEKFLCQEYLYVSDNATQSHLSLKSPQNRKAEEVGRITVDFTFLRDQLKPKREMRPDGKYVGKKHYRVAYTMVIQVRDRDLRCFAIHKGTVRVRAQINIASAFQPGVK